MSERHGEPLAPGDDSGWRIYGRDDKGEPRWVQHEPSGMLVWRDSTGRTTVEWSEAGLRQTTLHSSNITDACAEALALARRHLTSHLARLGGAAVGGGA
ncbi:MAG: hypothetical protein KC583_14905 [Myxococcales bacterium]|nr:hypothetical protein [Myxococcales bacterium]